MNFVSWLLAADGDGGGVISIPVTLLTLYSLYQRYVVCICSLCSRSHTSANPIHFVGRWSPEPGLLQSQCSTVLLAYCHQCNNFVVL